MCNTCSSSTHYGQSQPEARARDKAKLDRVLKARETKAARRENAKLN